MSITLLTLALSLPAAPAPAAKNERPEGMPPRVVMISPSGEGKLMILDTIQMNRAVQRTKQVTTPDGRVVNVTENVVVTVPVTVQRVVDLDNVRFYGHDGKRIDNKEARKQLTKSMPALMSVDGERVDRFYLRMVREGTLVLVIPPMEGAGPGGDVKPPDGDRPRPKPREKDK